MAVCNWGVSEVGKTDLLICNPEVSTPFVETSAVVRFLTQTQNLIGFLCVCFFSHIYIDKKLRIYCSLKTKPNKRFPNTVIYTHVAEIMHAAALNYASVPRVNFDCLDKETDKTC